MSGVKRTLLAVLALTLAAAFLSGCSGPGLLVVPVGEPIILTQPVTVYGALARDKSGQWVRTQGPAVIPAGWACWYLDQRDVRKEP